MGRLPAPCSRSISAFVLAKASFGCLAILPLPVAHIREGPR